MKKGLGNGTHAKCLCLDLYSTRYSQVSKDYLWSKQPPQPYKSILLLVNLLSPVGINSLMPLWEWSTWQSAAPSLTAFDSSNSHSPENIILVLYTHLLFTYMLMWCPKVYRQFLYSLGEISKLIPWGKHMVITSSLIYHQIIKKVLGLNVTFVFSQIYCLCVYKLNFGYSFFANLFILQKEKHSEAE